MRHPNRPTNNLVLLLRRATLLVAVPFAVPLPLPEPDALHQTLDPTESFPHIAKARAQHVNARTQVPLHPVDALAQPVDARIQPPLHSVDALAQLPAQLAHVSAHRPVRCGDCDQNHDPRGNDGPNCSKFSTHDKLLFSFPFSFAFVVRMHLARRHAPRNIRHQRMCTLDRQRPRRKRPIAPACRARLPLWPVGIATVRAGQEEARLRESTRLRGLGVPAYEPDPILFDTCWRTPWRGWTRAGCGSCPPSKLEGATASASRCPSQPRPLSAHVVLAASSRPPIPHST